MTFTLTFIISQYHDSMCPISEMLEGDPTFPSFWAIQELVIHAVKIV